MSGDSYSHHAPDQREPYDHGLLNLIQEARDRQQRFEAELRYLASLENAIDHMAHCREEARVAAWHFMNGEPQQIAEPPPPLPEWHASDYESEPEQPVKSPLRLKGEKLMQHIYSQMADLE